ncbi:hypothetical protein KAI46_11815 [bacterium]|nr:hypothetical protein [bacterium]
MYDLPRTPPPTPNQIPAILASQYASALSLRKRQTRTSQLKSNRKAPNSKPKRKANYREILRILKQTCKKLKLHEHDLHISLLELPNGFLLKAYDCHSNHQVCRQLSERFFYSQEKIERLLKEIMSGTGLLIDLTG